MPKRTNEFQRLILLIERQLAEDGATVCESRLLTDAVTGEAREVDVVIEVRNGPRFLLVGIECVDGRRRATRPWVEQMIAKHEHLPVNQTILVSRLGFTRSALKKAAAHNVLAWSLHEAERASWTVVVN